MAVLAKSYHFREENGVGGRWISFLLYRFLFRDITEAAKYDKCNQALFSGVVPIVFDFGTRKKDCCRKYEFKKFNT